MDRRAIPGPELLKRKPATTQVMPRLTREASYVRDEKYFVVQGNMVKDASDVSVPFDNYENPPPCPDCAGNLQWNEAGHVPGSLKCANCGSEFNSN